MLEFLFSKPKPQKPFINLLSSGSGLPIIVKDETYGAVVEIIKKLE